MVRNIPARSASEGVREGRMDWVPADSLAGVSGWYSEVEFQGLRIRDALTGASGWNEIDSGIVLIPSKSAIRLDPIMPDPLAYFLTWTTYGSWLPGDARGWINSRHGGVQAPDQERESFTRQSLRQAAVTLDAGQRDLVDETIRRHCEIRQWSLLAINVRTNHVHVVVTADVKPEVVLAQFKAWSSRRLNENYGGSSDQGAPRRKWWTEHGSTRWINDEKSLATAIRYVLEEQ